MTPLPVGRLEATEEHVEAFKALAHLSRLQIFFLLVRAKNEMSVGEIQAEVEIPGPTLSHHLDALRRAGLLESRKEGAQRSSPHARVQWPANRMGVGGPTRGPPPWSTDV